MRLAIALIGIALVYACDLLEERRAEIVRVIVAIITVALLTACESVPTSTPPPVIDNEPPVVICAIPAGMTESKAEPSKPIGNYSQRDVGLYLQALHRWGSRGWLRLARVDERSRECQARALAPNEP
ncbi:hypothetical protein BTW08_15325 [Salinicola sp. MH3R3-1]|uniref:hypothetical protein n=1 Tax=Salinicola sp. MH3R3-1 TaxID=1928762 RepID=UPI00094F06C6|nr:hypothetical protein [Salinicola sp. MH3R3-1]OLO06864.1 hypothetical protein BTW08_15325 [Salinicola sp. MH3R3-1]